MKIDYHIPLQVIANSLQHYHYITIKVEENFGMDFFPSNEVALCITNIVFFIYNWGDLRLQINDTTNILLTIIGFLFAFAGINIYSIFNTNIETEKAK